MSGDSPSAHVTSQFDFIDGRASPAPTTSKDAGVQNTGAVTASVLVEPPKEKSRGKDQEDETIELNSPIANSTEDGDANEDSNRTLKVEDETDAGDRHKGDQKDDCGKKEGDGSDKLDAVFLPSRYDTKYPENNPDDDSCCIKCLSFTLECCECTIM